MEFWFSEMHTDNVKISVRVNRQLFGAQSDFQRIDVFDSPEFGLFLTSDGSIILADEISPDTCRLWDTATGEKLDKDRFRRDLGGVEEAYAEIMKRLVEHGAN